MTKVLTCKPWITVELGQYSTAREYVDAAKDVGVSCESLAYEALAGLTFSGERKMATLSLTTPAELDVVMGPRGLTSRDEIMCQYEGSALRVCTQEMILALSLTAAQVSSEIEYMSDFFVAPRYTYRKRVYTPAIYNAAYMLYYRTKYIGVSLTGKGREIRTDGGGACFRTNTRIVVCVG